MTETVVIDRPSVAKPVSRRRFAKPATVSASALARHLDCSRTYIGKLEAEGVIQRQGDGFPLDPCRVALRYLRRERRQSPRAKADADHVKVKTEMLQLRLMEKKRELMCRADVDADRAGENNLPDWSLYFPRCAQNALTALVRHPKKDFCDNICHWRTYAPQQRLPFDPFDQQLRITPV